LEEAEEEAIRHAEEEKEREAAEAARSVFPSFSAIFSRKMQKLPLIFS
jgi:hypothetical protein